jgi:hypothetical protein
MNEPFTLAITSAPGDSQSDTFQNACQTSHDLESDGETSIAIAVTPKFPEHIKTREQAELYLYAVMNRTAEPNWKVEIQIGPEHAE